MTGRFLRRIWYLLNRRRLDEELARELAAHRSQMADPRRFGGTLRLREESRDVWGWAWLDDLWHDLRYGARQLLRAPGFALVAVLTLAVGIGANTTAFGILNAQLLAELPVPEPSALRQFEWAGRRDFSEATFRYVHEHASGFSAVSCVTNPAVITLEHGDRYEDARAMWVSGDFFRTFGFTTGMGRPLMPTDDRAAAPPVAVISYELWQGQFGAAASAVGSSVTVGDWPVTIVGVMRRGVSTSLGRRPPDLTLPMPLSARPAALDGAPRERPCRIVGRLLDGRPEELTRQESEMLLRRSGLPLPLGIETRPLRGSRQLGLRSASRGIDEVRPREVLANNVPQLTGALFLLLSVLIVPCANVAAMLLARATTRRSEIVARLALGASRARLIRQLLTEGLLLSALAGTVGVLISAVLMRNLEPGSTLDGSVLVMTVALCGLATVSFALAPALTATRGDLASRIRESSAGSPGRLRRAPGAVLVAIQVVVSCVLLSAAVLQARTLLASTRSTVTEPDRLLLFDVDPGRSGPTGAFVENALSVLASLPGVVSAGASSSDGLYVTLCENVDGRAGRQMPVWLYAASPGYFSTMKSPVEQGRDLTSGDNAAGVGVAVITDGLARSLFGRVEVVGRRLPLMECPSYPATLVVEALTIVGVVADGYAPPTIYLPYKQVGSSHIAFRQSPITFAARSTGTAATLAKPVRLAMQQAAGGTIRAMHTQAEGLAERARATRMLTAVYLLLGLLATGQAASGLYGTVSHFVNLRTAEIGIRMVLGARASDVIRLVIRQALAPVLIGLLLGVACSPIVARVMEAGSVISAVGWGELLAVSAGISMVMLSAFAAASMPVWRVSRIEPATALRED